MKENCRSPKSVPKIRREPSPQYVSDRLRRARNCSNERRDDSTIRSFEYIRSTDPIRISPRCTVESERHPQSHSKRSRMGESTHSNQLPERVLKLVVSPCKKENGHCSSQKFCDGKDDLNIIGIYMKVLEELKQEINSLEGGNLNGKTPISAFIDECFHTTNSRSSVIDGNQLSGYTRTLAVECVDIIERVVLQQNEIISELNNESKLSPKKKIKTLLLNVMLGIEHELILSEKILEIVETDLHHSSFQFIYCLLKHFVEKIAVHLKTSSGSNLGLSHLDEPSVDWRVQHALSRASISNCKIEEYSNRLDNLLKQWSGTGDTLPKIDTSQQVVIDCYHCLSDKKERDLLLKTVTRFTEEIQRKLIECHGGEKIARLPKNSATEKISEASKIEEPSANDTGCSTEMSTYNSWSGSNRPRLNNRRILSQYSNQADPSSLRNRNSYQDSVKEGRNTRNLSPPLAQSSIKASNYSSIASGRNYFSKTQSSVVSNNRGMPPSIIDRSIHHDKYPPLLDDTEHFRGKSPTKREGNNYHHNSLYTQEGNANKLISAPSFADNRRHNMAPFSPDVNNYQGSSPSMSSSANGRNYHTKPSTSLTDDTLVSYLQQSKKEIRNHHTKFPYIAAKEENKLVTAPYNPNDINHHNKNPIMTGDDTYRGNSTVCAERRWSISMDYPKTRPSTDVGKYYQNIPPPRNDVNYNSMPPNMSNNNAVPPPLPQIPNVCTIPPPMTLKPFPKLQLPTFDPCRTVDSRCYCNVPRCMSQVPSNQGCNLFSKGKTCLIICEDKPKPPYFDGYPGFNGAGFYGNGYDYSFQPQMLNTFPVSTQPKNEKKDKNSKKDKNEERKKSSSKSISSPIADGKSVFNFSPTLDKEEEGSKSKMDVSRNEQLQSKDVENKSGVPKGEPSFGDTHSVRKQSQTNDAKPSIPSTTESKPAPDAQQKKNNSKLAVENSSSRDHLQEGTSSSKQPDANQTHADNHCICCKCKQNKENAENAAFFLNPCYCNSQDPKGGRPIFQFFANPIPCDCQQKSGVQAPKSQLQDQKRDSQDAGTQTGKKPTPCRSAEQVAPTQSEHENAPCILSSESCTCTVSRTSSRNKKDPENNQPEKSKSNTNCTCPQDIEEVFQNFDDNYSKCVQEIKVLIREGHLRRYNGSDESFTVTREITVVPSKSKSGEDKPKEAPRQHLEFRESQDKIKSEDSYAAPKSPNKPPTQTPTDLRSDIEELKRLIKDTRFGHCPCCKCCKCEKEVKVSDESSKPHDEQDKSRPEPSLAQGQPDSKHDERKLSTSLPPAEYFDKMVDPKGASIAKDEQGKHKVEASPVAGEKPTGKSTKGMNEATKNSNRNVPTKDQKPDQSFKSLNERPGSIPKDDPRILPKNTSSKEIVEPKKEPAESSKTKDESPEYQSERDQEIKDTNNEPPEGSKIIHISPSYIDPEGLPAVVKELIAKEPAKDLEPGSKLDSNKQEVRKSQDQDQQEQKQFLSASRSLTSSSNKNFETKQEGGKVGSRSFTSDDSKNRKPKQGGESLGRISDEKIESKENLHRQPKAKSGLQPSTLDQNNEPKTREGQEMGEGTGDISTPIIDSASGPVTTPRGTKVSVGGGKVVIEVPIGPKNAEPLEKKESRITTVSDKGPSLEAEGEYGGEKQGPERKPETTAGKRKLDNELDEKKKSKAEMENESEIGSNRPKPRRVETTDKTLEPASSAADKKKFMSGNEGDKQRKLSLERQALDESRDRFFSEKRADNEGFARRGDEDAGKSWSPFEGVFGSGREKESGISEKRSKTDAGSQSSKTGARIDDSGSNVLQKPDGDEVSIESEASSTTVTDDCDDLFNSQPCTFYSEESGVSSITEAIKATETELYVMIIESQPPLVQSHDRHDEIISLLLSDNNVSDFSGNSDLGNGSTSKTSIPNSQQSSLPTKPHCARRAPHNGREKQSCFPVELITLQTSDESVLLDTDIGSSAVVESNSSNEQPLPLERATSSSLHIINKVMKERKIGGSKEERDSRRRSCSVRKRADKKKVHYSNIPNRIHDEMTGSRESARPVEELDLAENVKNQEVQVTKWNCKVQTAGPRKFNLTDIPREMEDKLAKYLGLERTVEVMDLKEKTFKDEKSPTPRENSNLKESKRSFQKNRQTAKLLSAKGK